jgi:hypothetical protein
MTLLRRLRIPVAQLALLGLVAAPLVVPNLAVANHAVYVEGESDFDGDGRIGTAEDTDGDAVFGKINSAIGNVAMGGMALAGNLANNGKAIIVTSGRFLEVVNITGPVTLEAAPGVEADIEAFLSPAVDAARLADFDTPMSNNASRQMAPGVIINAPPDRPVVLRNLTIRNWTDGVRVTQGNVLIDNVRIEHNVMNGVAVSGSAQVAIVNTSVAASGFRVNPASGDFPRAITPNPGFGVRFTMTSSGDIQRSSLTANFNSGLSNEAARLRDVQIRDVQQFGNNFGNPAAVTLVNQCRQATNRNLDEAELCVQAVQRLLFGIQDTP